MAKSNILKSALSSEQMAGRGYILYFALKKMIFALLFLIPAYWTLKGIWFKKWPQIEAKIVSAGECKNYYESKIIYQCEVEIEYIINGVKIKTLIPYKYHKKQIELGKKVIIIYNPDNPYDIMTFDKRKSFEITGKILLFWGLLFSAKPLTTALLALVLNNNKFFEFIWGIKLTKASMKM